MAYVGHHSAQIGQPDLSVGNVTDFMAASVAAAFDPDEGASAAVWSFSNDGWGVGTGHHDPFRCAAAPVTNTRLTGHAPPAYRIVDPAHVRTRLPAD